MLIKSNLLPKKLEAAERPLKEFKPLLCGITRTGARDETGPRSAVAIPGLPKTGTHNILEINSSLLPRPMQRPHGRGKLRNATIESIPRDRWGE